MLSSTRQKLKISAHTEKVTPKTVLDQAYCSAGDVTNARSIGELPRGPRDVYNARFSSKKARLISQKMAMYKEFMEYGLFSKRRNEKKKAPPTLYLSENVEYIPISL